MSDLPPPSAPVPPEVPGVSPPPVEPPPVPTEEPDMFSSSGDPLPKSKEEEILGMVMHAGTLLVLASMSWMVPPLNLIVPGLLWLVKRSDSAYLDAHGKEVVNFNIGAAVVALIATVPFVGCLMWPLVIAIAALGVMGTIQASERKLFRYPLTLRFIR